MQRDPGLYLDAAHRLWNATFGELSDAVADESLPRPVRKAADVTLRMKGEFMLPDAPRTEQGGIAKLATALAAIPDLSLADLNRIDIAPKQAFQTPPVSSSFRAPAAVRKRSRKAFRVALLGAALLLALEALARAGVPVPSVGGIVDRIQPDEPEGQVTPHETLEQAFDASTNDGTTHLVGSDVIAERAAIVRSPNATGDKNPHYANGRERNQANGKERNQANGRERNGSHQPAATHPASAHGSPATGDRHSSAGISRADRNTERRPGR